MYASDVILAADLSSGILLTARSTNLSTSISLWDRSEHLRGHGRTPRFSRLILLPFHFRCDLVVHRRLGVLPLDHHPTPSAFRQLESLEYRDSPLILDSRLYGRSELQRRLEGEIDMPQELSGNHDDVRFTVFDDVVRLG